MEMDWIWLMVPVFIGLVMAGSVKFIRPRERGLVERFGKYNRFANPGLKIVLLGVERLLRVNITEQMVDAARQEVITKDNLNAQVDAQIYYKILKSEENVKNSQYNVDDIDVQIIQLSRTTLRDIIGNMKLIEVNSKRNQVNDSLAKDLREQTKNWGIEVVRAELKEIEPPGPVQSAMNQVVVAENEKMAAVDFATAKETEADGERRAEIKVAEGRKQAAILIAEGKARAIKDVNESARKYFVGNAQPYKRLEVANNVLKNNTKIIVPEKSDLVNVVDGLIGGVIPVKKKGGK